MKQEVLGMPGVFWDAERLTLTGTPSHPGVYKSINTPDGLGMLLTDKPLPTGTTKPLLKRIKDAFTGWKSY